MALKGTLINIAAILAGTLIGLLVGNRYPEKMKQTVMSGLGLVTSIIGIKMALESANILFPLAGIALGGITGELLDLDFWINRLGDSIEKKFSRAGCGGSGNSAAAPAQGLFARGFVAATLLFCIGPMAIVGGIQDGLTGDFSTLAAKATIDGFTSIAFASSLGPGVAFSALPVFIYQGAISLGAGFFNRILSAEMIAEMTSAGGLLLFAIGLGLLEVKKIRTANLLPAIFLTPVICYIAALIGM